MARPPPSRAHDHDRLRLPPASSPQNSEAGKKESTVHRLNQLCLPCATPFSKSSLDHRRSVARVVKNGFAASSGVSESAKVVLDCGRGAIVDCSAYHWPDPLVRQEQVVVDDAPALFRSLDHAQPQFHKLGLVGRTDPG